MDYFPIFIETTNRKVLFIGGGEDIGHKLLLLGKTSAARHVFGPIADDRIAGLVAEGAVVHHPGGLSRNDTQNAVLAYIGTEDETDRDEAIAILGAAGVPYCVIDDRARSQFITPSLVDRDPVVVAIGTSGTAPILGRLLKAQIESLMPNWLGWLAGKAETLRGRLDHLPKGTLRRQVWLQFFEQMLHARKHETARPLLADCEIHLDRLIGQVQSETRPEVHPVRFVSAGPGDPQLLTKAAQKALDDADVVLHDRLVPRPVLELCRREAVLVETGKTGFGKSMPQQDIHALTVSKALAGHKVVRLKSGDAGMFGRLDEEIAALDAAGINHDVIPGITAASAAAAAMGVSLTKRGRNSAVTMVTGHDIRGYAEQDWRNLSRPGAVTCIYMGIKALPFIQGRLLMHGARPDLEVTIAERVGHQHGRIIATSLAQMNDMAKAQGLHGPAVIMIGLHPHASEVNMPALSFQAEQDEHGDQVVIQGRVQ